MAERGKTASLLGQGVDQMFSINVLPDRISDLFEKYGERPLIKIDQYVDISDIDLSPKYGVGVVPYTKAKKMILVRQSYHLVGIEGNWTIPGGKVELGESFEEAAVREANEETGINMEINDLFKVFYFRNINDDVHVENWYMPVFIGNVVSETESHECDEIAEVGKFSELPPGFAGIFNGYYKDLIDTISSRTFP